MKQKRSAKYRPAPQPKPRTEMLAGVEWGYTFLQYVLTVSSVQARITIEGKVFYLWINDKLARDAEGNHYRFITAEAAAQYAVAELRKLLHDLQQLLGGADAQ